MKSRDNLKSIKYWGASTSAHQVEGGNHNQWSVWELENASDLAANAEEKFANWLPNWDEVKDDATRPENYVSGIAADHYNKYEEDFDILTSLNMNAYRFSIEWSRVEPEEGKWDENEIEHYRRYLKALKKRKIEPFVTLWHWTMPTWFIEKGAFEKRKNIRYLVRFNEKIIKELGDLFTYVIILNEPDTYIQMSYVSGDWPPAHKSLPRAVRVYHNLISAHKQSYKSIKSLNSEMIVGSALSLTPTTTVNNQFVEKSLANMKMYLFNWYFFNRSEEYHDYIGVNYYFNDRFNGYRIEGYFMEDTKEKQNDLGWEMIPGGIGTILEDAHEKYELPIIILENGLADKDDKYRKWWLEETLHAMSEAIESGAQIDGYLHWSLLDNFEWADGFWPRFGLVEVDRKTLTRTVRPSAKWFAGQIKKILE